MGLKKMKEINTIEKLGYYLINKYTYSQILLYLDNYRVHTDDEKIAKHLEELINSLRRA